ncbi:signal transduction histidine kinase [Auriculariales sp. MPI-PUGE-AT-0066]|nr:signal transduction histidine kinase [Auriculariales sp. MPI-PUGE-AT-0066]
MAAATTSMSTTTTATRTRSAGTDARRTPLASPTTEPKINPLDKELADKKITSPSVAATASSATTPTPATTAPSKLSNATSQLKEAAEANDEPPASEDVIDEDTFAQILELEEDDGSYDFSLGMTQAYLTQAKDTFKEMDEALGRKDLKRLSELGHFLKGSSAALGVSKVHHSCEYMQNYGKCKNATGAKAISEDVALARITTLLGRVKTEFDEAEIYLKEWYEEHGASL